MFNLFSFEDEDLAKIKKTILILSSLILIGWWYGLSADLGKIAVLGPDTTAILSFYNLLSPFVIYFLFRLAVTAWWTLPKLNLDFNKLSLNSDDIISNLNSELKKFNENTAFLRDQIEAAHDFSVQVKIDNLPALDEFLADAKKLASFEKTNSMDTGHLSDDAFEARNAQLKEMRESYNKIKEKYPKGLAVAFNKNAFSPVLEVQNILTENHNRLDRIGQSQQRLESLLDGELKTVQTALARFGTSAETVVNRQKIDVWIFGIIVPFTYALAALSIPAIWP